MKDDKKGDKKKENNENRNESQNESQNGNRNEALKSEGENFTGTASDFEFLQERIKEHPVNKKKLLRRTITTASLAVLFGVLACLSFLLLEPVLNNWLYPEEEPEVVTFPQEKNEMLPEDMLTEGTTSSQEEESEETDESIRQTESGTDEAEDGDRTAQETDSAVAESTDEDINDEEKTDEKNADSSDERYTEEGNPVENDLDEKNSAASVETEAVEPLGQYQTQYEKLYDIYREVEPSMVTVTAVHSNVDWFNNPYQSEGSTAGVIIANNNRELLILSRKSPLDGAEIIRISFCNGLSADAVIKQYDSNTDLTVLAVDLKYIGNTTLEQVSVATLGSSASKGTSGEGITGTPVVAVGNLFGYKDSVCYGMVTSSGNAISMVDSEYKLITTDIYADTNPSGILVNMDREVIGIIDNSHNHDDTRNLLSAIGITELKEMIAKLSNGEPIPYLGIYTQDIDAQIRTEQGLPQGAYVFDIDMDSPAMLKGIQKGDILVRIGTQEIRSAADYMNVLRNVSIERSINIVVQRASVNAYEEMQFTIQPTIKQ